MNRHILGALGATVLLTLANSTALSHITLEKSEAQPSSPYKAILRVPHGCVGDATTGLSVKVPEGIIAAKPMPKPGWTVDIVKGDYAKAYAFYHGTTLAKGATAITWKGGSLPDDMYDEFVFTAFVSDAFKPGDIVVFPVTQTCASGKTASWTEVAKPGQDPHELKTPAPILRIGGGDKAPPHHH